VSDNSVISSDPASRATPTRMRDGTDEGTGKYSCQFPASRFPQEGDRAPNSNYRQFKTMVRIR
jgi:hypothetical protein